MTHETRFRRAMAPGMAFSVLREHATSQFDDRVIQHVMTVWPAMVKTHGLVAVGKNVDVYKQPEIETNAMQVDDVDELLISVDAEI